MICFDSRVVGDPVQAMSQEIPPDAHTPTRIDNGSRYVRGTLATIQTSRALLGGRTEKLLCSGIFKRWSRKALSVSACFLVSSYPRRATVSVRPDLRVNVGISHGNLITDGRIFSA